ncbi:MAG: hypothetical protein E6F98_06040 [Actinobacteria bacterium]|nr:MAG: hypothetical protein E6F98_06040 [Actinomycetota bacterium]
MRWKSFAVAAAAVLAVPLSAQAAGTPNAHWFAGSVASAGSGSVSVNVLWTGKHDTQLKGTTVTVGIDSSTEIAYGKHQSSIDPGDLVRVVAVDTTAKRIHVNCNCHFAAGTLDAISTSQLRVAVKRTGPYDGVLKDHNVTFQIGSASLPNLSIGDRVAVVFSSTGFFRDPSFDPTTATFTVLRVRVVHDKGEAATNP